MPSTELVRFRATDGLWLAGLLYEGRASARHGRAIVWLHGLGSSVFESARTNPLAEVFLGNGIAFFPFNNRGAGLRAGFERIRDCVFDIDGAIRLLRRRGYDDITLIGHSTGANKIAVYDHYKPRNRIRRYVLLAGVDDTGGLYRELGARRFRAWLKRTRSNELVPGRLMSWRAFDDMANPNGDYNVFPFDRAIRGRRPFRYIRAIRKPSLYVYPENDEYGFDAGLLAENIGPNGEIVVMRKADHGFHGREKELAKLIVEWMSSRA